MAWDKHVTELINRNCVTSSSQSNKDDEHGWFLDNLTSCGNNSTSCGNNLTSCGNNSTSCGNHFMHIQDEQRWKILCFDCHRRRIESWVKTKKIVFVAVKMRLLSFTKYTKGISNVQCRP